MLLGLYRFVGGVTVGICLWVLLVYALREAKRCWQERRTK